MKSFETHHKNIKRRLIVLYFIFSSISIFLISGLGYRQLIEGKKYTQKENIQSLRKIIYPGTRGNIYDRKNRLLVGNRPVFSVVIHLSDLKKEFDKEYYSIVKKFRELKIKIDRRALRKQSRKNVILNYTELLSKVLERPVQFKDNDLERHFSQRLLLPFTLLEDISSEEFSKITDHFSPDSPIEIFIDSARYYPHPLIASHVLGYVANDLKVTDDGLPFDSITTLSTKGKIGKSGLELQFENYLQGESGGKIWKVGPDGTTHEIVFEKQPTQGKDLRTTIDIDLQIVTEKGLRNKKGAAIAIDVESGEILAMASAPTYDLNDLSPKIPIQIYNKINEEGGWLNRAIQGLYPPGSPFKIITSIALLKENKINSSTISKCDGTYLVGKRKYPCHKRYGHNEITLIEAIGTSCNVFYYENTMKMDPTILYQEACNFGLSEKTYIELPYESGRCIVPNQEWKKNKNLGPWVPGDTANMCIGQGFLLVTPMQMACFAASIARNETRTKPTIILDSDIIKDSHYHNSELIDLPREKLKLIQDGMSYSTEYGTGKLTRLNNISIASKTGTAQAPLKGKYINMAWYIGYAPVENPKIAVCVLIEGTEKFDQLHGGTNASPVAKEMFKKYFELYPQALISPLTID